MEEINKQILSKASQVLFRSSPGYFCVKITTKRNKQQNHPKENTGGINYARIYRNTPGLFEEGILAYKARESDQTSRSDISVSVQLQ
jgi:hypothetical protein